MKLPTSDIEGSFCSRLSRCDHSGRFEVGCKALSDLQIDCSPPSSPLPKASAFDNAEMLPSFMVTIIASSSPDIKALNLPRTPSFPTKHGYDFDLFGNLGHSDASYRLEESQHVIQPDTETPAPSPRSRAPDANETWDDNSSEDLFSTPYSKVVLSSSESSPDRFCHSQHRDRLLLAYPVCPCTPEQKKEDIDPNTTTLARRAQKERGNFMSTETDDESFTVFREQLLRRGRKSWHRRDSIRSLPSPEDIGSSPTRTPHRHNLSTRTPTFTSPAFD